MSPDHTVYVPRFGLGGGYENKPNLQGFQTGNNFAAVLRGLVPVRLEGSYTFVLTIGRADTASLTIDGAELIATGCSRTPQEYSVTVHLGSGAHLLLVFADDGWSDHLVRPPPPPAALASASAPAAAAASTPAPSHSLSLACRAYACVWGGRGGGVPIHHDCDAMAGAAISRGRHGRRRRRRAYGR